MKKYRIGFICGFFDLLHDGHIDILRQAKEQCKYLIVAVGTDEFMKQRKGREPVLNYEQRIEIIRAIRYVDEVVEEVNLDKIAAYHLYHFDVMFAGEDHLDEPIYIEATQQLKKMGVETIYIPRKRKSSSTNIRNRVTMLAEISDIALNKNVHPGETAP